MKRLIKVAKDCKQTHTQITSSKSKPEKSVQPQDHVLGKKFAEIVTKKAMEESEDSDLDLDFLPEEAHVPEPNGNDIANANIAVATNATSGFSPTRPTPLPLSSLNILHRTDHAPGPSSNADVAHTSHPVLHIQHSALSRAFVRTIGRLGRWTRVLNSRSAGRSPISACADSSAFDLDLSVGRDLLTMNGSVETYLKAAESRRQGLSSRASQATLVTSRLSLPQTNSSLSVSDQLGDDASTPVVSHFIPSAFSAEGHNETSGLPPPPDYAEATRHSTDQQQKEVMETRPVSQELITPIQANGGDDGAQSFDRPISIMTTSTMSYGTPLSELGQAPTFPSLGNSHRQMDVASLDDLDLSDSSSETSVRGPAAPPGLRKASRKLPLRRDFEFVTRPETVSSLGIASRASVVSASSEASMQGLGGAIQQWQMNALIDSLSDEEETGDAEAALRRLEGHINPARQQEKASKVNGWVRTIQERLAAGDYEEEGPRFPIDSDEEDGETDDDSVSQIGQGSLTPPTSDSNDSNVNETSEKRNETDTPHSDYITHEIPLHSPGLEPPISPTTVESKPSPEDVVPLEILQSRMPISPSGTPGTPISKFGTTPIAPRMHRSFILGARAEVFAQHFSMIDRELFMGIKFEELVLDDWAGTEEIDILDWTVYLKDRARYKAEHRFPEKTSALAAVRARFNLTANFVISEIILTQPNQRPLIVEKFIRIAWVYLVLFFQISFF